VFVYQAKRENHTGTNTREAGVVATRALGKPLPDFVEIHHVDGNPGNNNNCNLVICEDASYHQILHARTKAFLECGNSSWRRCRYCSQYDSPENLQMHSDTGTYKHKECSKVFQKMYHKLHKKGLSHSYILNLFKACLKYPEPENN
jgi:hypothetical protein